MNINELIKTLQDKLESNDSETCCWCESSDYSVDKDGNRTRDPDEIVEYHFDCEDDCLERLIPEALEILRQAVEHPPTEPPPDKQKVLIDTGSFFALAYRERDLWYGGVAPGGLIYYREVKSWWKLPKRTK